MTIARKTPLARTAFRTARPTGVLAQASFQKIARVRKCAVCREPFTPARPTMKACGPACAEAFGIAAGLRAERVAAKAVRIAVKVERANDKARLIAMKPLKWHRKKAKTAMHAYVRARDEGKECASCGTLLIVLGRMGGDYDAGHFRAVAAAKNLEFDPRNIWGQCKYCNDRLRGAFQAYEAKLRLREGDAFVGELLADNAPRHLKIHDFQAIEAHYKAALKQLKGK
jgi:hypothetical protein